MSLEVGREGRGGEGRGGEGGREGSDDCYRPTYYSDGTIYTDQQ